MKFQDTKFPSDTIEAVIRDGICSDLVEIEIQGDRAECVYLTSENARKLGNHLIELSKTLEK